MPGNHTNYLVLNQGIIICTRSTSVTKRTLLPRTSNPDPFRKVLYLNQSYLKLNPEPHHLASQELTSRASKVFDDMSRRWPGHCHFHCQVFFQNVFQPAVDYQRSMYYGLVQISDMVVVGARKESSRIDVLVVFPLIFSFTVRNKNKSQGAKSELYGG